MISMRKLHSVCVSFYFLPDNVRVILTFNVLNSSEYILKYSATDVERETTGDGVNIFFLHENWVSSLDG